MATILRCKVGARMRPLMPLTRRSKSAGGKNVKCTGGPFHGVRLYLHGSTLTFRAKQCGIGHYDSTGIWCFD